MRPEALVSAVVTQGSGGFNTVATLTFSSFDPGDTLSFEVDRDNDASNAYGNGVDQIQGSTITATVTNADTTTGSAAGHAGESVFAEVELQSGLRPD